MNIVSSVPLLCEKSFYNFLKLLSIHCMDTVEVEYINSFEKNYLT